METAQASQDAQITPLDWQALGGRGQAATEAAQVQARALARTLAAHAIVTERDAAPEELEDRFEAVLETVWPKGRALDGYALQSSLGAHVIAKVAFDLVPAGRTALRHEPWARAGVVGALLEHGLDEVSAASVLGDWGHVSEGFAGDPQGLSASTIAGLAERTLTRAERRRALDQIAVSPRCLNRLAATLDLLAATRLLLPLIPPEAAGPELLLSVVGLALGRPDRVVQLLDGRAKTLRAKTMLELAQAQWALLQAEPTSLDEDPLTFAPPLDGDAREPTPRADTEVMGAPEADGEDGDDDVLEIVEAREEPEPEAAPGGVTAPARWVEGLEPLADDRLEAFYAALAELRTVAARAGGLLGVAPAPASNTVPARPVPADERLIASLDARDEDGGSDEDLTERISIDPLLHGHQIEVEGLPLDPLFTPVRGALRALCAAAEGNAVSASAVEAAGDLAWALARARSLAALVQGDLTEAQAAVAGMPEVAAPEGRWAKDRAVRFSGREAPPLDPREARPVAAALVADLAHQLARTLAGTARAAEA